MALIVGDLIHRSFKALGLKVTFVRNFTDVDDKIIDAARKRNIDPLVHSNEYLIECEKDIASLGLLPADYAPKVSETIPEIIVMIETLISKNYAYEVNGEVLYHVPAFADYGKLSKKDLESLQHGIRVEVDEHKRHPSDFVLWKPAKEGEPWWNSPWGKGRPGWHIECSAMSKKFLGETIDIHHGGVDLIFPHHENEIAQSEAANGKPFAHYWCHNEFLNFGKEKMSKSLGNVITIRKFVENYGGEILRQIISSAHYRSKIEWGDAAIDRAIRDVERIHRFVINYTHAKQNNQGDETLLSETQEIREMFKGMQEEIANDINISGALGILFSMIRNLNRDFLEENFNYTQKKKLSSDLIAEVDKVLDFFKLATGLIHDRPNLIIEKMNVARSKLSSSENQLSPEAISGFLSERKEARLSRNYKRSDEIRDQLKAAGVSIKDNPDGTTSWSYV